MSGGGRFFAGDVGSIGKKKEEEIRREKETKTSGKGRLTSRIDKSLRRLGGKSTAFK